MGLWPEFSVNSATLWLLLSCSSLTGCGSPQIPATGSQTEQRYVPTVAVLAMDRSSTDLASLVRGKPALVNFWATWCDGCQKELAALDRLQQRIGQRAVVVAVAVGEPYERVLEFVKSRRPSYPLLIDERFALADALGYKRIPTTVIVDRSLLIRYAGGKLDPAALAELSAVIAE